MNIWQKIDELDDKKAGDMLKEILREYIKPAYGSMSKRDFDITLFMKLQKLDLIDKNPEIYDIVSSLKVTRAKARNLVYESKMRSSTETDLEDELRKLLSSPVLKDNDKISLEVDNPYLIDYLRSKLKKLNHITDGFFSSEIVKMTPEAYSVLFVSLIPTSKKEIRDKLVECGAKEDDSLGGILISITKKIASRVAGKVGEEIVESVGGDISDYLKPIIEGKIEDIGEKFKDFWNSSIDVGDNN